MVSYYTERRDIRDESSLSWDIAHHLYGRCTDTPAIVVTDKPVAMLASVSKQWHKLLRQALQERSSTLNADILIKLSDQIAQMEKIRFIPASPGESPYGDLFFVTPEKMVREPQPCSTLYVISRLTKDDFARATRHIADHGLVVVYNPTL